MKMKIWDRVNRTTKNSSKRFKIKLKTKMIISFALILIIPSLIISTFSYIKARNEMENQFLNTSHENVKIVDNIIRNTLGTSIYQTVIYSEKIKFDEQSEESNTTVRTEFDKYMELNPEIESVFFGSKAGTLIQSPNSILGKGYDPRKDAWYTNGMEKEGAVYVSSPYTSIATGSLVVAVSKQTEDKKGVVGMEVSLERIKSLVSNVKIGDKGFIIIFNQDKKYIVHPKEEAGTTAKQSVFNQMFDKNEGSIDLTDGGNKYIMQYITNETVGWKLAGVVDKSEINDMTFPILYQTVLVIVVSLLVSGFFIFILINSFIKPLNKLKESAIKMSEGNLTEKVDILREDEIGQVALALKNMAENLHNIIKDVNEKSEHVAASSEQLLASSDQTASASEYVAGALEEVASKAEMQKDNLTKNTNALKDIENHINKVAESAKIVSTLTNETVIQAQEGENTVNNTLSQMNEIYHSVESSNQQILSLQERSQEIESIVETISGIANQTNLLALNAAIEAARAGEHGKGFAVVATEVGKLAKQSEQSAQEIGDIITNILMNTKTTVEGMGAVTKSVQNGILASKQTTEAFNGIIQRVKTISPQMTEVANLSNQIAEQVQAVSVSANELLTISSENAAYSEEMASSTEEQLAAMQEIKAAASSLSDVAVELQEKINTFTI
ncbi:methyl-accepting chemotaxis protein [Cytobacillus oceanisediminis]|uniref:Methyl-accepting chemotaxis protein n=1 Tax=Niallia alba TaxID=2729105 RepID=A0A7Y0KAM9_9BACI|nr:MULTISPECIES: methyl-accepting chemotaxis protein [Bacillaceae]MBZ9535438.1 methyl-accepting chemotaxis protein [Cytobacillus oceanisediminis]NMO78727.1 methyl-accepting chemotaxis protein [Niallia alba]